MKTPEPLMRAVVVESLGGPEVLNVREVPRPSPAAGEALIQVHRAGVNYTDLDGASAAGGSLASRSPSFPDGRSPADGSATACALSAC